MKRRKRKKRADVFRTTVPSAAEIGIEPSFKIAAWCPDEAAQEPPEQVHFQMIVPGMEDMPFVVRFKSPDTLATIIEELIMMRRIVWPDADPI